MCAITQEFTSRLVHPQTPSYCYIDFKERPETISSEVFLSVTTQCRAPGRCSHLAPFFQQKNPGRWGSAFQSRLCSLSALGWIRKVSQLRWLWSIECLQGQQREPGLICFCRGMRTKAPLMNRGQGDVLVVPTKAIHLGMELGFSWPSWSSPFSLKMI